MFFLFLFLFPLFFFLFVGASARCDLLSTSVIGTSALSSSTRPRCDVCYAIRLKYICLFLLWGSPHQHHVQSWRCDAAHSRWRWVVADCSCARWFQVFQPSIFRASPPVSSPGVVTFFGLLAVSAAHHVNQNTSFQPGANGALASRHAPERSPTPRTASFLYRSVLAVRSLRALAEVQLWWLVSRRLSEGRGWPLSSCGQLVSPSHSKLIVIHLSIKRDLRPALLLVKLWDNPRSRNLRQTFVWKFLSASFRQLCSRRKSSNCVRNLDKIGFVGFWRQTVCQTFPSDCLTLLSTLVTDANFMRSYKNCTTLTSVGFLLKTGASLAPQWCPDWTYLAWGAILWFSFRTWMESGTLAKAIRWTQKLRFPSPRAF